MNITTPAKDYVLTTNYFIKENSSYPPHWILFCWTNQAWMMCTEYNSLACTRISSQNCGWYYNQSLHHNLHRWNEGNLSVQCIFCVTTDHRVRINLKKKKKSDGKQNIISKKKKGNICSPEALSILRHSEQKIPQKWSTVTIIHDVICQKFQFI